MSNDVIMKCLDIAELSCAVIPHAVHLLGKIWKDVWIVRAILASLKINYQSLIKYRYSSKTA